MQLAQVKTVRLTDKSLRVLPYDTVIRVREWLGRCDPRNLVRMALAPTLEEAVDILRQELALLLRNYDPKLECKHFEFEIGFSTVEAGLVSLPGTVWCRWHNVGGGSA